MPEKQTAIQNPTASYSPRVTDEVKRSNRLTVIRNYRNLSRRHPDKPDFSDPVTVDELIESYLDECERICQLPSVESFCVFCGVSRRWFYLFLDTHKETKSADRLEWFQTLCAGVKISSNENGCLSDASMIFCLKNIRLDYADRVEITPAAPASPLADLDTIAARRRLIEAIPDEDD